MTFRPFIPAEGPAWLPKMADSVAGLFRRILPAPLRLFRSAADLPQAGAYEGGLLWDAITANVACSDGAGWKYWSFADHVHGAASISSVPAGSLTATDVQAAIDELDAIKAPLASPGLTGTPTAPTAAAGTETGQIATTAFVRAEAAALADGAPATLDTLNALAAALGDDPDFAATMGAALAAKIDDSQVSAFGLTLIDDADAAAARGTLAAEAKLSVFRTGEGSRTFALTDADTMIAQAAGAVRTYTIPDNATVAFPIGTRIWIGAVAATAGFNLVRAPGVALWHEAANANRTCTGGAMLTKTGTDEWHLLGNGIV